VEITYLTKKNTEKQLGWVILTNQEEEKGWRLRFGNEKRERNKGILMDNFGKCTKSLSSNKVISEYRIHMDCHSN